MLEGVWGRMLEVEWGYERKVGLGCWRGSGVGCWKWSGVMSERWGSRSFLKIFICAYYHKSIHSQFYLSQCFSLSLFNSNSPVKIRSKIGKPERNSKVLF